MAILFTQVGMDSPVPNTLFRDFTDNRDVSCKSAGDTVLTIVAGPLNYFGANPKVDCDVKVPQPSK